MILAPTGPWWHNPNYHYQIHSSTLNLANIDEGCVASLIDRLKNKESSGIDKLSNKHIKAAKNVIAKPLALMINQMLKVLEKCTKNLIGHSRLAFNNHESNIDC